MPELLTKELLLAMERNTYKEFTLEVAVIWSDIINGKKADCYWCPWALAIKRTIGNLFEGSVTPGILVSVSGTSLTVEISLKHEHNDFLINGRLSAEVMNWIAIFDMTKPVKPEQAAFYVEAFRRAA